MVVVLFTISLNKSLNHTSTRKQLKIRKAQRKLKQNLK
jgi:hypothetical protein